MKLIVFELTSSVYQKIRPKKDTLVSVIRPHLFFKNVPAGSARVKIASNTGSVLATSDWVDFSDMVTTHDHFHGYVKFEVSYFMEAGTNYRIYVEAGNGYSATPTSWAGVVNDYDLQKYNRLFTPTSNYLCPLDIEMWRRKLK
jgi:hypothetical protein